MANVTKLLSSNETYATVLLAILLDKFESDFIEWEPEVLGDEIHENFGVRVSDQNMDKIQAACSLLSTDLFNQSLETFIAVCNALDGYKPGEDVFVPPDVRECLWGCVEAGLILGEDYNKKFSPNIANYVGVTLANEGIFHEPAALKFAIYPPQSSNVGDNLENDPLMSGSFYNIQEDNKLQLEKEVMDRLRELFMQLREANEELKTFDNAFINRAISKTAT